MSVARGALHRVRGERVARGGPDRSGHYYWNHYRQLGRIGPRGDRDRHQSGDQRRLHRRDHRSRRLHDHRRNDRRVLDQGGAVGIQERAVEGGALGGADGAHRFQARDRHTRGAARRGGHKRRPPDRERRCRQQARTRAGGEAAGPGPQPGDGDALHRRSHHAQPGVVQQSQEHQRRPSLRERSARAGQQLHARRRRHERRHRQSDRLSAEPRRGRAGQRRDQQLLARARKRRRRDRQHGHQVGDQPRLRQRLLLLARQRSRGDAVGDQPRRRAQVGVQPQDLRRHRRWPDREEQAVLLRRLPGRATTVAAGRFVRDGDSRRVAQRRSEQPAGGKHADRRPRSADQAAVSEQSDSGESLQPVRAQSARGRGRFTRAPTSRGR